MVHDKPELQTLRSLGGSYAADNMVQKNYFAKGISDEILLLNATDTIFAFQKNKWGKIRLKDYLIKSGEFLYFQFLVDSLVMFGFRVQDEEQMVYSHMISDDIMDSLILHQ